MLDVQKQSEQHLRRIGLAWRHQVNTKRWGEAGWNFTDGPSWAKFEAESLEMKASLERRGYDVWYFMEGRA